MNPQTLRYVNAKTAVLIFKPENRRYLTGFASSLGYLLMTEGENYLFVDGRYYEAALCSANNCKVLLTESIYNQINSIIADKQISKLLIETENEICFLNTLKKHISAKIVPSAALSERISIMRSVKNSEEIKSVCEAQNIAEKAYYDLLSYIKVGMTEREIAAFLEYRMKLYGSENEAFDTIAVSGKNSSLPHGVPTDKPVYAGEFITLDFGAKINGYCSDMTRTVAVGFATDEMQEVYNTVLNAQLNAEKTVKAGVICSDVDNAARSVIESAGYGKYFTHSNGHGIGLEVHEIPTISFRNDKTRLRAGQLISNEPGIYIPQKFGVRIEDMLFVKKLGCKNLTKAPKNLIIL